MRRGRATYFLKGAAGLLLVAASVLALRLFVVESLHLSTGAMEASLHRGDFVLLDKTPFGKRPARNAVMAFRSPLRKDSLRPPLFVSRCIALPGDTIRVTAGGYRINGKEYPRSPQARSLYFMEGRGKEAFLRLLERLPGRAAGGWREDGGGIACILTSFEAYQIREGLPRRLQDAFRPYAAPDYRLVVPRKGRMYALDSLSLLACREALLDETGGKAVFKDGKMFLDGKEVDFFFPRQDYYWFLSDGKEEAIDSRHLGFIPRDRLLGRLFFCWFSTDKNNRLARVR